MRNKYLVIIFAFIILAAAAAIFLLNRMPQDNMTAEIVSDGEVIERIDLHALDKPQDITVNTPDGGFNTVHLEHGSASVTDANCPDKLCVKQGEIKNGVYPIICLPHKLTVRIITGDNKDNNSIDAVVGR